MIDPTTFLVEPVELLTADHGLPIQLAAGQGPAILEELPDAVVTVTMNTASGPIFLKVQGTAASVREAFLDGVHRVRGSRSIKDDLLDLDSKDAVDLFLAYLSEHPSRIHEVVGALRDSVDL